MKKKKAPVYKYNYANGGQFGDFMQSNAGSIGSLVGGGIGLAFGVPQVGAALGGAAGNAIQGNYQQNEAQDANMAQINAQNRSLALTNYNNRQQVSPAYGANFAIGGDINRIKPKSFDPIKHKQHQTALAKQAKTNPNIKLVNGTYITVGKNKPIAMDRNAINTFMDDPIPATQDTTLLRGQPTEMLPFKPADPNATVVPFAMGGDLNSKGLDNITEYSPNAGTHEQSKLGGIPLGKKGKVEAGEVRYNDYIFSNRF